MGHIGIDFSAVCSICGHDVKCTPQDVKEEPFASTYVVAHEHTHQSCRGGRHVIGMKRRIKHGLVVGSIEARKELERRNYFTKWLITSCKCKCGAMVKTNAIQNFEDHVNGRDIYIVDVFISGVGGPFEKAQHWQHGGFVTTIERRLAGDGT